MGREVRIFRKIHFLEAQNWTKSDIVLEVKCRQLLTNNSIIEAGFSGKSVKRKSEISGISVQQKPSYKEVEFLSW